MFGQRRQMVRECGVRSRLHNEKQKTVLNRGGGLRFEVCKTNDAALSLIPSCMWPKHISVSQTNWDSNDPPVWEACSGLTCQSHQPSAGVSKLWEQCWVFRWIKLWSKYLLKTWFYLPPCLSITLSRGLSTVLFKRLYDPTCIRPQLDGELWTVCFACCKTL